MAPPATVDWDALRAMDAPSPFAIAEPSALSEHPAPRASAEAEAETLAVLTAPAPAPVPIVGLTQSDRDKFASEAIDAGVDPAAVLDHVEAMADRLGPQVLLYYGTSVTDAGSISTGAWRRLSGFARRVGARVACMCAS